MFAFLPAVFIIYRLLPGIRSRNVFLALSSLVFYAFGQLVYLPLFLASILINYISGLLLSGKFRRSRLILTLAVVLNLGILCVFKYTDFLIGNINSLFGTAIPLTGIVLPIGISFFTFQGALVHDRCLPRTGMRYARFHKAAALYILLPAAHRGTDRQIS